MAADIQIVLRKKLCHLTGSKLEEKVDDHLEKAMTNYEKLRQVDKDHGEMMDEFLNSANEARTLLDNGTDDSPRTLSESGVRASANTHSRSYMSMHADPS